MLGPDSFCFLNESRAIKAPVDWNNPRWPRLWLYHLHYFDDLNATNAAARAVWHQAWIERWIRENPAVAGAGWEPYPLSRRVVNWIKFLLRGGASGQAIIDSLATQARWLLRRLEWHLGGNHLIANARALIFAGAFFQGPEPDQWLERGRTLLTGQLKEQILPDGGHYERSPMYHALVLEDLLDSCNILRCYGYDVPPSWHACAHSMRTWLAAMVHPDGEIAFFNDAAFGMAAAPAQLEHYAHRLLLPPRAVAEGSVLLTDSGYARLSVADALLLADCGAIGPDHLPGHAHADTLSFELSLGAERVLVNSGTSLYEVGSERLRQRGTAAHNTVVVALENSSEVWHAFRVARRARIRDVTFSADPQAPSVWATHDGYARLGRQNLHARSWQLRAGSLRIEDSISGAPAAAVAHFHLHPQLTLAAHDPAEGTVQIVTTNGRRLRFRFSEGAALEVYESSWHPHFGSSEPARALRVRFRGPRLCTTIEWS